MSRRMKGYGWYIKRIDNALAREACRNVQAHNLTMQQSHMLFCLSDAPEQTLTLKELETIFGCAQSTVAGLVARLEKKGLVEGYTESDDRRIKHVRLTAEGAAMREICHQDMRNSEARLCAALTEAEKELLLSCLKKVYDSLHEDAEDEMIDPPPCVNQKKRRG